MKSIENALSLKYSEAFLFAVGSEKHFKLPVVCGGFSIRFPFLMIRFTAPLDKYMASHYKATHRKIPSTAIEEKIVKCVGKRTRRIGINKFICSIVEIIMLPASS